MAVKSAETITAAISFPSLDEIGRFITVDAAMLMATDEKTPFTLFAKAIPPLP